MTARDSVIGGYVDVRAEGTEGLIELTTRPRGHARSDQPSGRLSLPQGQRLAVPRPEQAKALGRVVGQADLDDNVPKNKQ